MTGQKGNRSFTRSYVGNRVDVVTPGGSKATGELEDLSMSGLKMKTGSTLREKGEYSLTILLQASPRKYIPVRMKGYVARSARGTAAFEFTEIDAECLDHLQNLVLYNADNPEVVEEEIE